MKKYNYLISDVDGIITDGGHYYTEEGKTLKKFGSNDKDALKKINDLFVDKIIFVSADKRGFKITQKRISEELGYDVKLVLDHERADFLSSLDGKNIFIGDGIYDTLSFPCVDYSICLSDSTPQAKNAATTILDTVAGKNVFSHVLNLLESAEKEFSRDKHKEDNCTPVDENLNDGCMEDLKKLASSVKDLEMNKFEIANFCKSVSDSYTGKNKIIFCGVGKNATLSEMVCEFLHPYNVISITLDPHRAVHGNLGLIDKDDVLILSTKSGNTSELLYLMECLKRKMELKNKFLIVSNPDAELKKKFNFKDILIMPNKEEIAQFSHSPQTTILLYTTVMMVLVNAISKKKNLSERDYLLNHQAGEIGKSLKNG